MPSDLALHIRLHICDGVGRVVPASHPTLLSGGSSFNIVSDNSLSDGELAGVELVLALPPSEFGVLTLAAVVPVGLASQLRAS